MNNDQEFEEAIKKALKESKTKEDLEEKLHEIADEFNRPVVIEHHGMKLIEIPPKPNKN